MGLFQNKEPNNARHARWCIDLSMLKVVVKYEPGKKNALADSLSRIDRKDNKEELTKVTSIVNIKDQEHKSMNNRHKSMVNKKILKEKDEYKKINGLNVVNMLNKLSILNENINNDKKEENIIMLDILKNVDNYYENNIEDDICKQTLKYKNFALNNTKHVTPLISYMVVNKDQEGNIQEEDNNELAEFMKKFIDNKIFEIDNNKYYRDNGVYRRIVEEEEEKIKLIWEAHRIGHEGVDKTYQRLRRHFYWKGMINDIKSTIKLCTKCQLYKSSKSPDPTEKYATPVEGPFTHLGLDIIGPLPITERNNQYIIVIVDYFTKWVEAEPLASITSKDVIYFLSRVFSRHGTPQVITTDNRTQFNADMTRIFLDLYDVYIHFATSYHPETNGMTENRNREIGKYLRLLGEKEQDWDLVLPAALWALRTSRNTATKYSSFELLYGRVDQQPFELATTLPTTNVQATNEEKLLEKFCDHYKWVIEASHNMKKINRKWEQERNENYKNNKQNKIKINDLVKVRNFSRFKFDPYYVGPYKVIGINFNTVKLADPTTNLVLERPVHLKNVLKYNTTSE